MNHVHCIDVGLTVRFSQNVYRTSNERGVVDVCIVIPDTYEYDRDVSFNLTVITTESTASKSYVALFVYVMRKLSQMSCVV